MTSRQKELRKAARLETKHLLHELNAEGPAPSAEVCGPYKFDRITGAEVDEELGWGAPPLMTGSFIILPLA